MVVVVVGDCAPRVVISSRFWSTRHGLDGGNTSSSAVGDVGNILGCQRRVDAEDAVSA